MPVNNRGFTIFELLIVMAVIGIISAIAIPTIQESTNRNSVWQATEAIGAQIRQARLLAITKNMTFRIRFNCPDTGQMRLLRVTGDAAIDTATDRCSQYQTYDSGVTALPANTALSFSPSTVPTLTVTGRGTFTSSTSLPLAITVTYGGYSSRTLSVSASGQIAFDTY